MVSREEYKELLKIRDRDYIEDMLYDAKFTNKDYTSIIDKLVILQQGHIQEQKDLMIKQQRELTQLLISTLKEV